MGWIAGALPLALSIGTATAAIGLLRRRNWAWWFAVALFAVNGCGNLASLSLIGDWWRSASGVAVAAAFLLALLRSPVNSTSQAVLSPSVP